MPNCLIQILGADGSLLKISAVGASGRYVAADLPPGPLAIAAHCPGRQVVFHSVRLMAGDELTLDFRIPSPPTISGHVLDQNRKPLPNMSVWVIQSEYRFGSLHYSSIGPRTTGKDGGFNFESDLEAGRAYYLLADRPLTESEAKGEPVPLDQREPVEAPTYYGDATSLEGALPLVLLPGEHREQMEIKTRRATSYCVEGRLEVSGKPAFLGFSIYELPLAGTRVTRFKSYPAEDGRFRVCNLTPGQYWLSPTGSQMGGGEEFAITRSDIHHLGLALDTVPVHLELSWDGTPPFDPRALPGFAPAANANISMELQIVSGGEWMSPDGLFAVLRQPSDSRISVNLVGQPDGATRLKSELAPYDGPFGSEIPVGNYTVQVGVPTNAYLKEVTYGGVNVTNGLLQVLPGTNDTLRILVAHDGARLTYIVSDGGGTAVPYATVLLLPDRATTGPLLAATLQQVRADQSGTCVSGTLAPGKYRVLAINRPVRPIQEDMYRLMLALPKATEVELLPKASLEVKLQPVPID